MDKKELDFEIKETKRVIAELKLSADTGTVEMAQADLTYLLSLN